MKEKKKRGWRNKVEKIVEEGSADWVVEKVVGTQDGRHFETLAQPLNTSLLYHLWRASGLFTLWVAQRSAVVLPESTTATSSQEGDRVILTIKSHLII